jgi:hypothetical protein
MTKRALESYRFFPYLAWTLVIGFALFVYQLTVETSQKIASLGEQTQYLEQVVNERTGTTTLP